MRPSLPAGSLPTAVATGDFNNDGHTDFAVANGLTSDVWLYFGNGDGTFQNPRIIPLTKGLSPVSIAAVDLRANGKLDLILGEFDSSSVGVLLGNGDGTFGYETLYTLPSPTESIAVDDFNHDGKLDVAALLVAGNQNPMPYIALLKGDGTGSLAPPTISYNSGFISSAWNIASGDVNGDGLPDLLITGPSVLENSTIYLNNGDGTFVKGKTAVPNGPFAALLDGKLADVNGDHCLDAVVADASSAVWIAAGDCSGNFADPAFLEMGDSNAALKVADVNGDGIPDIVTSALPALDPTLGEISGNTLSIALGTGQGKFSAPRNYVGASQAYSIGAADFSGDGKLDFVTANNDSDIITVYRNDGTGGFGFPQGAYAGVPGQGVIDAPVSALSFADLNKDGKTDVFFLDEGYNGEYYATSFLNDGTGRFSGPLSSDLGIDLVSHWVGDHRIGAFRDSSRVDLLAIGLDQSFTASAQFIIFAPGNGDGTFGKGTVVTATGADGILTTGDFNRDGKLDFVAVNGSNTHTLTTFLGHGDGTFQSLSPITFSDTQTDAFETQPVRIYSGDFNRDGKLDLFVFTTGNGYFTTGSTVWEFTGNGDGTFQPGRQLYTHFQPLALADINADGFFDIARYDSDWPDGTTETFGTPRFTNYLGQADGTFAEAGTYTPYAGIPVPVLPYWQDGDPTSTSLVADLKGTGKPDEVALEEAGPGLPLKYAQILMGNGDGSFTPTYDVFPFYINNEPTYAHDLDGDGVADLVSLINATSSLQVYKGSHAPALQIGLNDSIVENNASCGWVFPDVVSNSDRTVSLTSSVSGVLLPSTVTIPSGASSSEFCYTLKSGFDWHQVFDINAQLDGDTATAYASASYVAGFTESLSSPANSTIYPGQSVGPISLTLTAAPGYSSTVHLYCQNLAPGDSCQFGSDTLDIFSTEPVSTTVTLITGPNSAYYGINPIFTVVADDGNVLRRQTVPVQLVVLNIFPFGPSTAEALSPGSTSLQLYVTGIPPLTFGCSGLPAGVSCAFSNPVSNMSNLTIWAPAGVAPANYPFEITVTSGPYSASTPASLDLYSLAVQPTSTSDQWAIPGTAKLLSVTLQASSNLTNKSPAISCSLDVAASSCSSAFASFVSGNPTKVSLALTVPSNAGTGEHQLSLTSLVAGGTQTSTFPFVLADFSGALSTSSISMTSGGTATATSTISATAGFSGQISLSCNNGSGVACSFAPKTVQLTGGAPQTVTITFTAPTIAAASRGPQVPVSSSPLMLVVVLPVFLTSGARRRRLFLWIGAFLLITGFSACGGGGSSGSSGSGGGGGTTNYSLSISATEAATGATRTLGNVTVTVTH